jgi:hypothetical protein
MSFVDSHEKVSALVPKLTTTVGDEDGKYALPLVFCYHPLHGLETDPLTDQSSDIITN